MLTPNENAAPIPECVVVAHMRLANNLLFNLEELASRLDSESQNDGKNSRDAQARMRVDAELIRRAIHVSAYEEDA